MDNQNFKRRKNARVYRDLQVDFRRSGSEEPFLEETTLNISRSGLCIRSEQIFPVKTELEIRLFPEEDEQPLHFTATVSRLIEDQAKGIRGLGIEIKKLSKEEQQRYEDFINLLHYYGWFC